ncbi:MAG: RICIN domain-containing protein [Pyrinomonadaceae bacterium MAG19_C2-C3]|nr:RICIN domain-containing protein [Pyrinomonadaceae bacterium MAG19_C2-C3]
MPAPGECYYDCYGGCYRGYISGSSLVWHDGRYVYGYAYSEMDYCGGLYYDPAIYSRFVEGNYQSENTRLLAQGYASGYADTNPAAVHFSYAYPIGNEYYNTDSIHYAIDAYDGRWYAMGRSDHTIRFPPPPDQCQPGQSFAPNGSPCPTPTPTPTPSPTPTQQARVSYRTSGSGVPLANGTAVGDLPNANFLEIVATGTPVGGTYTWSTNSSLVTLSSNSASTIKVFSKDRKSGSPDDVNIELRYKYGESESVAQIPLTVQQPTTMAYVATRSNSAGAANECRATVRGRRTDGWTKVIDWQVKDQFGNNMQFRMPLSDTINNDVPNSCLVPRKGGGTTPAQGRGTGGSGEWVHTYSVCSTTCLRGGSCAVTGYQRYTVNGFVLSNDDKSYTYQCNGISVEGDDSTPPPLTTPARKKTTAFVDYFYMGVVEWQPSDADLQTWTNRLNTAGGQGQAQLLAEAKALGRALFQSLDYASRNASDEEFVYNLFYGYYQRAPASPEHASWLSTLGSYNAQGQNGRELLLQSFETSSEFVNLVYSLELAPADEPSAELDPNAFYQVTARHSGKSLYIGSYSDGAFLQQWDYFGGFEQQFQFVPTGNGYYKILVRYSSKALEVQGAGTQNGARVIQQTYAGGTNQQWEVIPTGDGYFKIVARHSGKGLDVEGAYTHNGAYIHQWEYVGGANQQWQLLVVTDPVGCDLVQEQDCYSSGGSWDSSTCSCNYSYDPCYSNGTYICSN